MGKMLWLMPGSWALAVQRRSVDGEVASPISPAHPVSTCARNMQNNDTAKPLFCINGQPFAVKTTLKDQQTLINKNKEDYVTC